MLGVVIGIGVAMVVAYEWWMTRETLPPSEQSARDARAAIANAIDRAKLGNSTSAAVSLGVDPQVAARCGLQWGDETIAEAWSIARLGAGLPLRDRLSAMRSVSPPSTWPTAVQRVWCALNGRP